MTPSSPLTTPEYDEREVTTEVWTAKDEHAVRVTHRPTGCAGASQGQGLAFQKRVARGAMERSLALHLARRAHDADA